MNADLQVVPVEGNAASRLLGSIAGAVADDEPLPKEQKRLLEEASDAVYPAMPDAVPMGLHRSLAEIRWERPAERDLADVGEQESWRIREQVRRIAETGEADIRKVRGRTRGGSNLAFRVGDWRLFFEVDGATLRIVRILPRKTAYRKG